MATFNVFDRSPIDDWDSQSTQSTKWEKLGQDVGADPVFCPLTIKALYVTGIILAACESIEILLKNAGLISTTYFPAYAIFTSTIDLLGRCICGNDKPIGSTRDIKIGFQWLAQPSINSYMKVSDNQVLVTTYTSWGTRNREYKIKELVAMRHFAAHGQSSADDLPDFDYNIFGAMPPLLARGVEEYLRALESRAEPCAQLAKARIEPYRSRPIFDTLWRYHRHDQSFPTIVGDVLRKYDWSYKPPAL